jgi:hypothetical protein
MASPSSGSSIRRSGAERSGSVPVVDFGRSHHGGSLPTGHAGYA